MDFLPLESRKSVVAKAAQDEPGRLSGLAQEINSVKQELTSMRRHIDELASVHRQVDSLQTALLHEKSRRTAAEAAFCRDLSSGMQQMQATVAGMATAEVERPRDALAVLNLCKEVEREVREHARLHSDIVGIKNDSRQEVTMAGSASAAKERTIAEQDFSAEAISQMDALEQLETQ